MTQKRFLVEACVTSTEEASACSAAGARRAELCRVLEVGGLTPSHGVIKSAQALVSIPIVVLVRPRSGPFQLNPGEVTGLIEEVDSIARLGVDGVVVGVLDRRGSIDRSVLTELVSAANGLPVTFHRGFDEVSDPLTEIGTLADSGVTRVLTSGGAPTAWQGRRMLKELVEVSPGGITILGGGGIRGDHVRQLVEETGLKEVHGRASAVEGLVEALRTSP